jgi:hypothetical protein
MQVCRTIYGDDRPRLFIYYTVSKLIEVNDVEKKL